MLEFLFHYANLPFVIALGLMLGLGAVELISLLMGGSMGALSHDTGDVAIDVNLDPGVDVDVPDFDFDANLGTNLDINADAPLDVHGHHGVDASGSILQQSLGWLHLGRLPLMIILVLAFFSFGSAGLLTQSIVSTSTGHLLPSILAAIPALIVMVFFVRFAGLGLLAVMPRDETQAVHSRSFVGKEAVMVIGTATVQKAAQAKLRDQYGQTHYVMVHSRDEGVELTPGMRILIINQKQTRFRAIVHPLAPVSSADGAIAIPSNKDEFE